MRTRTPHEHQLSRRLSQLVPSLVQPVANLTLKLIRTNQPLERGHQFADDNRQQQSHLLIVACQAVQTPPNHGAATCDDTEGSGRLARPISQQA